MDIFWILDPDLHNKRCGSATVIISTGTICYRQEFSLCVNLNDLASYSEELTDKIRRSPSEVLPLFEEAAREVADEVSYLNFS